MTRPAVPERGCDGWLAMGSGRARARLARTAARFLLRLRRQFAHPAAGLPADRARMECRRNAARAAVGIVILKPCLIWAAPPEGATTSAICSRRIRVATGGRARRCRAGPPPPGAPLRDDRPGRNLRGAAVAPVRTRYSWNVPVNVSVKPSPEGNTQKSPWPRSVT